VSQPFTGEIKIMANNFPPRGFAVCAGQLLSIAQNTALFSLLGTSYGGDGRTTFALPNLQSKAPLMVGQGPGLSPYTLGETGGDPGIMLTSDQLPQHTHTVSGSAEQAVYPIPAPDRLFAQSTPGPVYQSNTSQNLTSLAPQTISKTGNSAPHNNLQPYVALNIVIALEGIYPKRPT
jgi:microcystin-dependent protein